MFAEHNERATILIVDDEPQNLHLLGELLMADHEVLAATSGEEAINRVQSSTPPDLILLDIMMPDMNGIQVCRKLKEDPITTDIPIIFITAMDDVKDETEGLAAGAVDYITKPFSPAILKARVKTHLKLKAQTDMLTKLSMVDGLTGIPNRRQFDLRIAQEWRRLTRSGEHLTLIMIDVDHFKQYNDNYGHAAGDQCLRQVAKALHGVIHRAEDLVARYGGEEFVGLLPGVNEDNSLIIGEWFRRAIEDSQIEHKFSSVSDVVTVSLGIATCRPKDHTTPEKLMKASDHALYTSKKSGRNRLSLDVI